MKVVSVVSVVSVVFVFLISFQVKAQTLYSQYLSKIVAARLLEEQSLRVVQVDIVNSLLGDISNRHLVSEFVVGKDNVKSFLTNAANWRPFVDPSTIPESSIEELSAPEGIEIAVFLFNHYYGTGRKMPVIIFDAAFDGQGIVTVADLMVGLEYETSRIEVITHGLRYGDSSISRNEYLQLDLQVQKSVLEAQAMDNVFSLIFDGSRQVSDRFFEELQVNFIKYLKILHAVADGYYWYKNGFGVPVYITGLNNKRLARAQLDKTRFKIAVMYSRGKEIEVITRKSGL